MEKETAKLLEQLAQKLGTTTEYLWSVLLKQAPIDATTTLIQNLVVIWVGYILFKAHKKLSKKVDDSRYADTGYEQLGYGGGAVTFIIGVFYLIVAIACFFCIGDIINGFFNPEYWALNHIISKLK